MNSTQANIDDLVLPGDIVASEYLGAGRRSNVYLGEYQSNKIVIKVYKPEYIEKYKDKYGVDIGEFEYMRNAKLYAQSDIREAIAKPYRLLRKEEGYTHALVQEYVLGTWLKDLASQLGHLPPEILRKGYEIVSHAARLGLYDLDISAGNIQVVQGEYGWYPKLYDFNLMPQHLAPPNPFMALGFVLGLRSKNYRDFRSLKTWREIGKQAQAAKQQGISS